MAPNSKPTSTPSCVNGFVFGGFGAFFGKRERGRERVKKKKKIPQSNVVSEQNS